MDLPAGVCTVVHLQAHRQGHTLLTVTYQAPKILLQASITIAAHMPLKVRTNIFLIEVHRALENQSHHSSLYTS